MMRPNTFRRDLTGYYSVYTRNSMTDPAFAECKECLCLASRRAARTITRSFDKHLRPTGLRATQFSLLVVLTLRGKSTITDLAEALGVERTTASRNLALVEGRGLVRINPGADARSREAEITAKGKAAISKALPAWQAAQKAVLSAVGEAGAAALRKLSGRKAG